MNNELRKEIKKIIISCKNYVEIFSNGKKYEGYALFKKIAKNIKQYYGVCQPDDIGQIKNSTYSVWITSEPNIKNIDQLIYKKVKFNKLYEKCNEETGCYELIAVKEEN